MLLNDLAEMRAARTVFPGRGQYYDASVRIERSPLFSAPGARAEAANASPDSHAAMRSRLIDRALATTKSERVRVWAFADGVRVCGDTDREGEPLIIRDAGMKGDVIWGRTEEAARVQRLGSVRPGAGDDGAMRARINEVVGPCYFFGLDLVLREAEAAPASVNVDGERWSALFEIKGDIGLSKVRVSGEVVNGRLEYQRVRSDSTTGLSTGVVYEYAFAAQQQDGRGMRFAPRVTWDDSWRGSRRTITLSVEPVVEAESERYLAIPSSETGDPVRDEPAGFAITDYTSGAGVTHTRAGGPPLAAGEMGRADVVSQREDESPASRSMRASGWSGWAVLVAAGGFVGCVVWWRARAGQR